MRDEIEQAKQARSLYTSAQKWRCDHDEVLDAALAPDTALKRLLGALGEW